MNVEKIIHEIVKSGLIPLLCGASVIFIEIANDPSIYWMLIGTGYLLYGVYLGFLYTSNPTQDTHEVGSKEES